MPRKEKRLVNVSPGDARSLLMGKGHVGSETIDVQVERPGCGVRHPGKLVVNGCKTYWDWPKRLKKGGRFNVYWN